MFDSPVNSIECDQDRCHRIPKESDLINKESNVRKQRDSLVCSVIAYQL